MGLFEKEISSVATQKEALDRKAKNLLLQPSNRASSHLYYFIQLLVLRYVYLPPIL